MRGTEHSPTSAPAPSEQTQEASAARRAAAKAHVCTAAQLPSPRGKRRAFFFLSFFFFSSLSSYVHVFHHALKYPHHYHLLPAAAGALLQGCTVGWVALRWLHGIPPPAAAVQNKRSPRAQRHQKGLKQPCPCCSRAWGEHGGGESRADVVG